MADIEIEYTTNVQVVRNGTTYAPDQPILLDPAAAKELKGLDAIRDAGTNPIKVVVPGDSSTVVTELQTKLADALNANAALQDGLETAKASGVDLTAKLAQAELTLGTQQSKLAELQDGNNDLQAKLFLVTGSHDALQAELDKAKADLVAALAAAVPTATAAAQTGDASASGAAGTGDAAAGDAKATAAAKTAAKAT